MPSTFYESIGGAFQNASGQSCFNSGSMPACSGGNFNGKNITAEILQRFIHLGINISGYNGSSIANTGSGSWSRLGGQGGAGLYIIAKNVVFSGTIRLNGGDGLFGAWYSTGSTIPTRPGSSAAGGGGSCILSCQNLISQNGTFQSNGGNMVNNTGNIGFAGNGAMLIVK
jgi:hypothetical protein